MKTKWMYRTIQIWHQLPSSSLGHFKSGINKSGISPVFMEYKQKKAMTFTAFPFLAFIPFFCHWNVAEKVSSTSPQRGRMLDSSAEAPWPTFAPSALSHPSTVTGCSWHSKWPLSHRSSWFLLLQGINRPPLPHLYPANSKCPSKLPHCLFPPVPRDHQGRQHFLKKWQVLALWQGEFKSSVADVMGRKQSLPWLCL